MRAVRFSVARARTVAFLARVVKSGRPAQQGQQLKNIRTAVECAGQGVSQIAIKDCFGIPIIILSRDVGSFS